MNPTNWRRKDLEKGERIGIPVALLILLALFGAVVAALVPLGLAVVARDNRPGRRGHNRSVF